MEKLTLLEQKQLWYYCQEQKHILYIYRYGIYRNRVFNGYSKTSTALETTDIQRKIDLKQKTYHILDRVKFTAFSILK